MQIQPENLSNPIDMHTHAGSTFNNCMTLTFDLRVNARRATAMYCMIARLFFF